MHQCPKCKSEELEVVVRVWATLLQDHEDGNIETDTSTPDDSDHSWDYNSPMQCTDCGHSGKAVEFEVEAQEVCECGHPAEFHICIQSGPNVGQLGECGYVGGPPCDCKLYKEVDARECALCGIRTVNWKTKDDEYQEAVCDPPCNKGCIGGHPAVNGVCEVPGCICIGEQVGDGGGEITVRTELDDSISEDIGDLVASAVAAGDDPQGFTPEYVLEVIEEREGNVQTYSTTPTLDDVKRILPREIAFHRKQMKLK